MSFKLPHQKTLKELLEELDKKQDEPQPEETVEVLPESLANSNDPVLRFISQFKISPGTRKVDARLLYRLFSQTVSNELTLQKFNSTMSRYFEKENIKSNTVYSIDSTKFQISHKLDVLEQERKDRFKKLETFNKLYYQFLKDNYIKPGKKYISNYIFYYWFTEWMLYQAPGRQYYSGYRRLLTSHMRLDFPHKKLSPTLTHFGVDYDLIKETLTNEKIEEYKERHNRYLIKRRQNSLKAKKKSLSRSRKRYESETEAGTFGLGLSEQTESDGEGVAE